MRGNVRLALSSADGVSGSDPVYSASAAPGSATASDPSRYPLMLFSLVDDDLALAGSANIDLRSLFLNFEVNCLFLSPTDSLALANWFTQLELLTVDYMPASARLGSRT